MLARSTGFEPRTWNCRPKAPQVLSKNGCESYWTIPFLTCRSAAIRGTLSMRSAVRRNRVNLMVTSPPYTFHFRKEYPAHGELP